MQITVISGSWRTVRIVQGVVNFNKMPTPSVEIRQSGVLDFDKGVTEESWEDFVRLMGWAVAAPAGDCLG